MELFRSELYYIFVRNESSLWWNRLTGAFLVKSAWDLSDIEDIECLGITEGIIGKVEHSNVYEPRLIIIKESVPVGQIYFHHTVYKVKSICMLNLGIANQEVSLAPCTKHGSNQVNSSRTMKKTSRLFENSAFLNKTVGAVTKVSNTIKSTTQNAATQVKHTVKKQRDPKVAERFEKRLTDELFRILEDNDSFYYSRTLDLTNSLQRQYETEKILEMEENAGKPITDVTRWWKHVDDRFFWNRYMLRDIIDLGSPQCDEWILPIIQGYVHLSQIPTEPVDANPLNTDSSNTHADETFTLGLISRRSRYQAGTRYNRRGVEPKGKVANYVETEQIVSIISSDVIHRVSFVQVRGSVPIFWSQPEAKFRPPPRIDKGEEDTQVAFKNHFDEQLRMYKQVCIINLVEQQGREKIIWETFSNHVVKFNSVDLIYVTFDFHEYCRGMHYENVGVLISAIADIINDMRFCWRDNRGLICTQKGVFRVNCIDCLDRTNVVQTAIAKYVLELQLCRLGLGTPGGGLPPALRNSFLTMWADNGDCISRQYAGTQALKGDYTRTGERKFTGLMKDGVASANRYYLSMFKDAFRQVAIDVMTGESRDIPEQLIGSDSDNSRCTTVKDLTHPDNEAMAQHIKSLIDDCKKLLVDTEPVLGSWGLIDADPNTGDPQETEMDSILLLTSDAYYVADYDETSDRILSVQRVPLRDVTTIELGTLDTNTNIFNVGRKNNTEPVVCIRIHYTYNHEEGYFHMFRSTTMRFFNNVPVAINTRDEMIESLHSICETIVVARAVSKLKPIPFYDGVKLDKRKSKIHPNQSQSSGRSSLYLELARLPTLTRNVSETQLVADIKSVGTCTKRGFRVKQQILHASAPYLCKILDSSTNVVFERLSVASQTVRSKALNNMTEQFSKLNKLGHSLNARARPSLQLKFDQGASRTKKMFTLGQAKPENKKKGSLSDGMSSDYSSDDEHRTNIFEPTLDNFENTQHYIGKGAGVKTKAETENDCDLIENPLYSSKIEQETREEFVPTDLMTNNIEKQALKTPSNISKKNPFNLDSESTVSSKTPEIQVDTDEVISKPVQPNPLILSQKLSHSSNDINYDEAGSSTQSVQFHIRSNSQQDITLNISQSHSESALKQLKNITSPATNTTRDMVLTPLSKLAKGVQNLGANLDPRNKTFKGSPNVKNVTEQQYEEHKKLQETWRDCNTRLIAL